MKLETAATISPLLVLSPHYDDAVFSCGALVAAVPGCTIVTVYTGLPANADIKTDWDGLCGFSNAHEAMLSRADENRQARSAMTIPGGRRALYALPPIYWMPIPASPC